MAFLYQEILYRPLLNALVFLYNTIAFHDLGVAIILVTLLIRLVLFPLFQKSTRHQLIMQHLQPRLKKIQQEFKNDMKGQGEAMMQLYKEYGINPFSGFGFLVIQVLILIPLYSIFRNIFEVNAFTKLYSFVAQPGALNETFLSLINLKSHGMLTAGFLIVIAAAIAQFIQIKLSLPKSHPGSMPETEQMNRVMMFVGPVLTLVIFSRLPAAVSLYWLTTSVFSIIQQSIISRQLQNGKLGNINEKSD
jgi:YidC/Oxa1 family membrane protein insertase